VEELTPESHGRSGRPSAASLLLRAFFIAAALYVLVKIAFLTTYSIHTRFVMDEYESIGAWVRIPDGLYQTVVPVRTLLATYFYQLPRLLVDDAVDLMTVGRLQTLLLAGFMIALVYGISRNLGRDRAEALISVVAVLAFSTFMERAFRMRADTVAAFLSLVGLWSATRPRWSHGQATLAGVFAGLAFLATQKAVFAVIAMALGYVTAGAGRRNRLIALALFAAGWVGTVLAYSLFFGGTRFPRVLWLVFSMPTELAFDADRHYTGLRTMVLQTLGRNLGVYMLSLWGLALAFRQFGRADSHYRLAAVYSLLLGTLVFSHNQPWPYVFVSVLPVLALWSVEPVRWIAAGALDRRNLLLLFGVILAFGTLARNARYLQHNNAIQNRVARSAERLLDPSDRYCDGIRMIGSRQSACDTWWDAMTRARLLKMTSAGDSSWIQSILSRQPKVWILSYRFDHMAPVLRPHIARSYDRVDRNTLLSGAEFSDAGETEFVNYWPGCYRAYDRYGRPSGGRFLVDGETRQNEVQLPEGRFMIGRERFGPSDPVRLLPCGTHLESLLPVREVPERLFDAVYTF